MDTVTLKFRLIFFEAGAMDFIGGVPNLSASRIKTLGNKGGCFLVFFRRLLGGTPPNDDSLEMAILLAVGFEGTEPLSSWGDEYPLLSSWGDETPLPSGLGLAPPFRLCVRLFV